MASDIVVRSYAGPQAKATAAFEADAASMAAAGWFPISEGYKHSRFHWLWVLLSALLFFAEFDFDEPGGTLTVAYQFRSVPVPGTTGTASVDDVETAAAKDPSHQHIEYVMPTGDPVDPGIGAYLVPLAVAIVVFVAAVLVIYLWLTS